MCLLRLHQCLVRNSQPQLLAIKTMFQMKLSLESEFQISIPQSIESRSNIYIYINIDQLLL